MPLEKPSSHQGLSYTDNISIAWTPVQEQLDQEHLARVNASNEGFLRDVSVIETGVISGDPVDPASAMVTELGRLDLKLNLIMNLVSSLIYHQMEIPDTSRVRVSSSGVIWKGQVPAPDQTVFLQLYIQRGLPKPLCCYGKVVSTQAQFEQGKAKVRFIGLTGAAQAWLEKLIFRHHRREIAYQRASSPS
ncbi:MAG: PilZ domain-containing protein [Pseudomonadota bacterium]